MDVFFFLKKNDWLFIVTESQIQPVPDLLLEICLF